MSTAPCARTASAMRGRSPTPDAEAGWAAVAVAVSGGTKVGDFEGKHERVTEAAAGRVDLELGSPAYRGATTQSNNTGELTALLRAVELEMRRPHVAVEFCVDSLYALGHATGRWEPPRRRNVELARRLRQSVRQLTALRGGPRNVTISHVRAHARTPGNEAADELAKVVTRDMGVSRDARRALKLAQQVHRRVYGESHTSATSASGGAPGRGFGDG